MHVFVAIGEKEKSASCKANLCNVKVLKFGASLASVL